MGPRGGPWFRVARLGGVRVYVDPLLFLLLAFVVLAAEGGSDTTTRLIVVAILLASVLLHELAHAWMARHRGLSVTGIFLHVLPFAYVERGEPADELRVAIAAPVLNVLLGGVLLGVLFLRGPLPEWTWSAWLSDLLAFAAAINLLMGVLNLVPALPADGGRVVRAFLLLRHPRPIAHTITARIGTFVGVGVMVLALYVRAWPDSLYLALLGVYLCMVAWREAATGRG